MVFSNTCSTNPSISFVVLTISTAEFPQFSANVRISSATTANPFPASPALAASIDAFKDNRFVCSAISVITLTIRLMPSKPFRTLFTALCNSSDTSEIWVILLVILPILFCPSKILFTVSLIFSSTITMASFVLDTLVANVLAPSVTVSIESDNCPMVSVKFDMVCCCLFAASFTFCAVAAFSSAFVSISVETTPICRMVSLIRPVNALIFSAISPISSEVFTRTTFLKSNLPNCFNPPFIF